MQNASEAVTVPVVSRCDARKILSLNSKTIDLSPETTVVGLLRFLCYVWCRLLLHL